MTELEEALKNHDVVINLFANKRIKAMAQKKAIRSGMSLSAYIRNLIIKDNE